MNNLRGIGELTLKGLVSVNAPTIFKGILNEWFRQQDITVKKVIPLIEQNKSLWLLFPPEYYPRLEKIASQVSDLSWLTADWVIDAVKEEHRALASLFLSWKKGRNWLDRQIEEMKSFATL